MPRPRPGFTLVELLAALTILTLLLALALPALSQARAQRDSARCLANLRQLAIGFHLYAADYDHRLPDEAVEDAWDELLRDYLRDDGIYLCPADPDARFAGELSYAWRSDGETFDPATGLTGRDVGEAAGDLVLVFDLLPDWHQDDALNAARLDASALTMPMDAWLADLLRRP